MRLLSLTVTAAWTCLGLFACSSPAPSSTPDHEDGLISVNGTRLFVHREGSGEPAIVIHGGPLLDHTYLQPYLAPLGAELEPIFHDQRLRGRPAGGLARTPALLAAVAASGRAPRARTRIAGGPGPPRSHGPTAAGWQRWGRPAVRNAPTANNCSKNACIDFGPSCRESCASSATPKPPSRWTTRSSGATGPGAN